MEGILQGTDELMKKMREREKGERRGESEPGSGED